MRSWSFWGVAGVLAVGTACVGGDEADKDGTEGSQGTDGSEGTDDTDGTDSDGTEAPEGPTLISLSAGQNTTCAVLDDGTARCWGDNREGQLGDGTTVSSVVPVAVKDLTDAVQISTGYEFSCALREGGTVVCWGSGTNGHLGNGSTDDSLVPVAVSDLTDVAEVRVGFTTACARKTDQTVWCWGRGGETGDADDLSEKTTPVQVPGLSDVASLAGASHGGTSLSSHTCGVREDGTAFCWGLNADGQCGNGTQDIARAPVEVSDLDDATVISSAMTHACATQGDGTWCWGASLMLGNGTVDRSLVPVKVSGDHVFTALTSGFDHSCGLATNGDVWCWGRNGSGQIGDGLELVVGDVRDVPAKAAVEDVELIAAGATHTCAYGAKVTRCWGRNEYGERGWGAVGSSERSNSPGLVVWTAE